MSKKLIFELRKRFFRLTRPTKKASANTGSEASKQRVVFPPKSNAIPDRVDVLIVGAGPAGLAAGQSLANSGASILLVDARQQIGRPLRCAEVTRPGFFDVMGFEPRRKWVRWTLKGSHNMLVLNRPQMENEIASSLESRGVEVRRGTSVINVGEFEGDGRRVTVQLSGHEHIVLARLVIAADGVSSQTARLAGVTTRLSTKQLLPCLMYRIADARLAHLYQAHTEDEHNLGAGFFWIVPTGADEANAGLCLPGWRGHEAQSVLDDILKKSPAISGGRVVETVVAAYPLTPPLEKPYADGLLIAGTAARLVGAARGEGIWYAAVSGQAAAQVALETGGQEPSVAGLAIYRDKLAPLYGELEAERQTLKARLERHPFSEQVGPLIESEMTGELISGRETRVLPACRGCTACVAVCPTQAIRVFPEGIIIVNDLCIRCGLCAALCPVQGIQLS